MKYLYLMIGLVFPGVIYTSTSIADDTNGFECSFPITEGSQSIRSFTLTEEVYQCLKYNGHRDMVVVNARGQKVPYRLSAPANKLDITTYSKDVAFYQEPDATSYKTGDQIRRLAGLTGVVSGNETDAQWQDKNTYYSSLIVEQSAVDPRESGDVLKSLTISIRSKNIPITATVIVESSNDLQHWTTLLTPNNILYLPGVNNILQSNRLKIVPRKGQKYLRLATLSNIENLTTEISHITATYEKSIHNAAEVKWFSAGALKPGDEEHAWIMSPTDIRPVSHLRFIPAENIVFYQGEVYRKLHIDPATEAAELQARRDAKNKIRTLIKNTVREPHVPRVEPVNPWRYMTRFTQYKMVTGSNTISNAEIQISPTQSNHWKFVFRQPQISDVSQLPTIEFGWTPPVITFVAQGAGPFSLLAGNVEVPQKQNVPEQLLSLTDNIETVALLNAVAAGNMKPAAIDTAEKLSGLKTNKMLLWIILLIGVMLMGVMAYTLSKKMNAAD